MTTRIIRLPEVIARTGYKRASVYAKIKDGTMPRPISIGPRAIGFLENEIEAWISDRIQASRPIDKGIHNECFRDRPCP